MRSPGSILKQSAVLFLVLAGALKHLPLLHHHPEKHACAEVDGTFLDVYIRPAIQTESQEEAGRESLAGIELGHSHHHDLCGLCQLAPATFPWSVVKSSWHQTDPRIFFHERQNPRALPHLLAYPRGPPSASVPV